MDAIKKLHLVADLADSKCELNHGPHKEMTPMAVNYFMLQLGHKGDAELDELAVAVCKDCMESLADDNWTLVYCFECASSQWIYQPEAKLEYLNSETGKHHHLIGVVGCPKCSGKLGGLYFLD